MGAMNNEVWGGEQVHCGDGTVCATMLPTTSQVGATVDVSVAQEAEMRKKSDDIEVCWICFDASRDDQPLESPCRCKGLKAHRLCLARWQLQQAGKAEERTCRFCKDELPDWRETHQGLPKATPIMTVVHEGVTHQVAVEPGKEGQEKFKADIRRIFGLSEQDAIQLTFGCRVPGSEHAGHEVTLEGWESFDAAVHCAAISAGQRLKQRQQSPSKRTIVRRFSNPGVLRRLFSKSYPGTDTDAQ